MERILRLSSHYTSSFSDNLQLVRRKHFHFPNGKPLSIDHLSGSSGILSSFLLGPPVDCQGAPANPLAQPRHANKAIFAWLPDEARAETFSWLSIAYHRTDPLREHYRKSQSCYYIIVTR